MNKQTDANLNVTLSNRVSGWARNHDLAKGMSPAPDAPNGLCHLRQRLAFEADGAHWCGEFSSTGLFAPGEARQLRNLRGLDVIALDADGGDWLAHQTGLAADFCKKRLQSMDQAELDATLAPMRQFIVDIGAKLGWAPTRLVYSGYGFHVWIWLSDVVYRGDVKFPAVQQGAHYFAAKANELAGFQLFDLGAAKDLGTRNLRPLYSKNEKGGKREFYREVRLTGRSDFRLDVNTLVEQVLAWQSYTPTLAASRADRRAQVAGQRAAAKLPKQAVDFDAFRLNDGRTLREAVQGMTPGAQRQLPAPAGRDGKGSLSALCGASGWITVTDFARQVTYHHEAPVGAAAAPTAVDVDATLNGLSASSGAVMSPPKAAPVVEVDRSPSPRQIAAEQASAAMGHGAIWEEGPAARGRAFLPKAKTRKVLEGDPGLATLEEEFAVEWGLDPAHIARTEVREIPEPEGFCTRGPVAHYASGGEVRSSSVSCDGYACPVCGPAQLAGAKAACCGVLSRLAAKGWIGYWAGQPAEADEAAWGMALKRWVAGAPTQRAWVAVPCSTGVDYLLIMADRSHRPSPPKKGPPNRLLAAISGADTIMDEELPHTAAARWSEVTAADLDRQGGRHHLNSACKPFRDLAAETKREMMGLARKVRSDKPVGEAVITAERAHDVAARVGARMATTPVISERPIKAGRQAVDWHLPGVSGMDALAAIEELRAGGQLSTPRRKVATAGLTRAAGGASSSFGFDDVEV